MKKQKYIAKTYKLTKDVAPLSFMLPTRNTKRFPLFYFDEETGQNRALRYSRNQKSIFEDEQDGNVILEPIIFDDGLLHVPKTNQLLQQFLSYHPYNGKSFIEVNLQQDAAAEVEILNLEVDALIAAKELNISQLEDMTRIIYGRDPSVMSTEELKRNVLVYAKTEPKEFLDIMSDPLLKLQSNVQSFFDSGVLVERSKGAIHFNLKKNKERVLIVPPGGDTRLLLTEYFQSDEGIPALKLLEKTMKN